MNHDSKHNDFEYEKETFQKHRSILNSLLLIR